MPKIKASKGFIFARVSTKEQYGDDHFGVPVQVERLREYAKRNQIKIEDEFEFPESAFRGKRTVFKKALDKAFQYQEIIEEPVALLFDEEDRLTRRAISDVMVKIDKMIEAGKIELHFKESNKAIHKDSSHSDILVFRIKCDVSEHESRGRSRKVKEAILYKLKKGQFPGFAPTGYLNDTKKKTVVPDPGRKDGIIKMFNLYSSGDYSAEEIAKTLRADGMTMKASKGRQPRLIAKGDIVSLLNKRFYTGEFEWTDPETDKMATWKGNYEPLITKELFQDVQEMLNQRAIRYSARHYSSTKFFKYRGLITCGFCDCKLTPQDLSSNYKNKEPGEAVYYRCTYGRKNTDAEYYERKFGKKNHSGVTKRKGKIVVNCPQLYWTEKDIDEWIKAKLKGLSMDKEVLKEIKEQLEVDFEERMTATEAQKKVLEADFKQKKGIKSCLIRRLAMEEKTAYADDIKEEIDKVKKEIDDIKSKLDDLEEEEEVNTNEIVNVLSLCSDLHKQFDKLKPAEQRQLVMIAFRRLTALKGKVGDTVIGNLDEKTGMIKDGYIDHYWTEPFWLLADKWLKELTPIPKLPKGYKYEKPSKEMRARVKAEIKKLTNNPINKTEMREPDKVGREDV